MKQLNYFCKECDIELVSDKILQRFSINIIRMKTQNILLLIGLMLLYAVKTLAQATQNTDEVIIHISAERLEQTRSIDIYKHFDEIKIVYAGSDSIKNIELRRDKEFLKVSNSYMKQIKANKISESTSDSLRMFFDRHRAYDRDSITFKVKTDTAYNNLLTRIIDASDEELLQPEKNARRAILDGIVISFNITNGLNKRSLFAHSPSAETHPLLYDLVKRTSKISTEKNLKFKGLFWY